ncbi:rhodanese-like domain-containing protein [Echinimonas agarilytica]|uniref:Rhodanese-like domain-containing protein n=1 Tax=Echinimonas agarilytica TaxID=1215918 RepID=A0AA41W896_9GAMM|nr:rhodanese-like domain-containing protein [Echinimonas agarilytica]MCM2681045.1 rhodanese-like domain-containing protein [Echinimonas agarilytica]
MDQFIEFVSANPLLSAAWVGLFIMLIYSFIGAKMRGYTSITSQELTMMVNREDATVVDIRPTDTFRKGHIAGAKNIVESKITENNKPELEKLSGHPIIVVCETGMTAGKSCAALKAMGFESIFSLRGGMAEWRQANLPTASK